MSGSPMRALQSGCTAVCEAFFGGESKPYEFLYLLEYNRECNEKEIKTKAVFEKAISELKAGGGTSFYAAFTRIQQKIEQIKKFHKLQEVVTIFMTDGADNFKDPNKDVLYQSFADWYSGL